MAGYTGYNYTKRSVHSLHDMLQFPWLHNLHKKKCYNYTKRSVHSSCAGYSYTKRSVHSLHGWLQLH